MGFNFRQQGQLSRISKESGERLTFVYAILNQRNRFIKIGRSIAPKFREKTLQSEEPEIELLFAYAVPLNFEKQLHQRFSSQRVRGEWFRLSEREILALENIVHNEAVIHDEELFEEMVTAYYANLPGEGRFSIAVQS